MSFKQKLSNFINHPYMAPVVEPVKGFCQHGVDSISGFIEDLQEGYEEGERGNKIVSAYKKLFSYSSNSEDANFLSAAITGVVGFIGMVGSGMSGDGLFVPVACTSIGATVAAPFIAHGLWALGAGAIFGTINAIPNAIKGFEKIKKYHQDPEGYKAQVAIKSKVTQSRADSVDKALQEVASMSIDERKEFIKAMRTDYTSIFNNVIQSEVDKKSADKIARIKTEYEVKTAHITDEEIPLKKAKFKKKV